MYKLEKAYKIRKGECVRRQMAIFCSHFLKAEEFTGVLMQLKAEKGMKFFIPCTVTP